MLFSGVIGLGTLCLFRYSASINIFGIHPPVALAEYFQIWLFFIALTLAYMITYSAIEADSPSLLIIMKIYEAGSSGLSKEILYREMNDDILIRPRVNDLIVDKMADLQGKRYRLKIKGIYMARLFTFFRGVMRAGKGG